MAAQRLAPPEEAITVRVRRGRIGTTCGPFSEAGERLVGYCVIEARDLNGAIQVASRISGARFGCVEVRPVAEDAGMLPALGPPRPGDPT